MVLGPQLLLRSVFLRGLFWQPYLFCDLSSGTKEREALLYPMAGVRAGTAGAKSCVTLWISLERELQFAWDPRETKYLFLAHCPCYSISKGWLASATLSQVCRRQEICLDQVPKSDFWSLYPEISIALDIDSISQSLSNQYTKTYKKDIYWSIKIVRHQKESK